MSLLAIISISYVRPQNLWVRLAYLLYIPGWLAMGGSVIMGDRITRRLVAAHNTAPVYLDDIRRLMNSEFSCQQDLFVAGLMMFGLWLCIYLIWWVFSPSSPDNPKTDRAPP